MEGERFDVRAFHAAGSHFLLPHGKHKHAASSRIRNWDDQPRALRYHNDDDDEKEKTSGKVGGVFLEKHESDIVFVLRASLGVSATRRGHELRVQPSSGNLHPVECYVANANELWHFLPREGKLELRAKAQSSTSLSSSISSISFPSPSLSSGAIIFSVLPYREYWKYGLRGWRYTLLDVGHAIASVMIALRNHHYECAVCSAPNEGDFLHQADLVLHEREVPMAAVLFRKRGENTPLAMPTNLHHLHFVGSPSAITVEKHPPADWPELNAFTNHILRHGINMGHCFPSGQILGDDVRFDEQICMQRRSARTFDPRVSAMANEDFRAILAQVNKTRWRYCIVVYFVHQVIGTPSGKYDGSGAIIRAGDARSDGEMLTGQELGRDGAFCAAICVDKKFVTDSGVDAYCGAHFEAGALGHVLYLASESVGAKANGMGFFYDNFAVRNDDNDDIVPLYCVGVGKMQ